MMTAIIKASNKIPPTIPITITRVLIPSLIENAITTFWEEFVFVFIMPIDIAFPDAILLKFYSLFCEIAEIPAILLELS
jgi:hypothetical protein